MMAADLSTSVSFLTDMLFSSFKRTMGKCVSSYGLQSSVMRQPLAAQVAGSNYVLNRTCGDMLRSHQPLSARGRLARR